MENSQECAKKKPTRNMHSTASNNPDSNCSLIKYMSDLYKPRTMNGFIDDKKQVLPARNTQDRAKIKSIPPKLPQHFAYMEQS